MAEKCANIWQKPNKSAENRQNWQKNCQNMEEKENAGHVLFLHFKAFHFFSVKYEANEMTL